jgi:hypothetical protein
VITIELEASSHAAREVAFVANWLIWAIFVAELVFILTVAPRKAAALKARWLDVTIIVVTAPAFGRLLASLRLVRLVRLLRLLRLAAIVTRAVQRERMVSTGATFRLVAPLTLAIVVLSGAVQGARGWRRFPLHLGRHLVGDGDRHDGRLRRSLPEDSRGPDHRGGSDALRDRLEAKMADLKQHLAISQRSS